MIYIFAALYPELEPVIKEFSLINKGDSVYVGDNIVATVTGVGKVNAAFSVGRTMSVYTPSDDDMAVNIGIAAGSDVGTTFLINSIHDRDTDKYYYPDMLYDLGLAEKALTTVSNIVSTVDDSLYDMEASAIYQTVSKYISPDNMFFIKTVSDAGANKDTKFTPEYVSNLMSSQVDMIKKLLTLDERIYINPINIVDVYSEKLFCSEYMRNELAQLVNFARTLEVDARALLDDIISNKNIVSRKDGREVLDAFKSRLTS